MALQLPESTDACIYFSRRTLEPKGHVIAWAEKKVCPSCGKAKMGKPVVKGKVKIRATEYVCPACGYTEEKKEHESTLELSAIYTCPYCEHKGEVTIPYKRKTWQGVPAFVFPCESCSEKIAITKKLKEPKKK